MNASILRNPVAYHFLLKKMVEITLINSFNRFPFSNDVSISFLGHIHANKIQSMKLGTDEFSVVKPRWRNLRDN